MLRGEAAAGAESLIAPQGPLVNISSGLTRAEENGLDAQIDAGSLAAVAI